MMILSKNKIRVTDPTRAIFGFLFGFAIMFAITNIFLVNRFDFDNLSRGTYALITGGNPWAAGTRLPHFYNPPFSVLFLWPLLFTTPKLIVAIGGAFLFAVIFYLKAWVACGWFLTNTFLYVISAGNIDMFVMGAGLSLLFIGDSERLYSNILGIMFRVLAYGLLMVKPQGGLVIVIIYILLRRDWKGLLISLILYGLFFINLYPDWLTVMMQNPPQAQNDAAHSMLKKFGLFYSLIIATGVTLSRKWKYWQLGGALAGILSPYGMPGIPIFLTLTAVNKLIGIPILIIYSACLSLLTWVTPPPGVEFYSFISPYMSIYHLSMLGLSLVLACCLPGNVETDNDTIDLAGWLKSLFHQFHLGALFGFKSTEDLSRVSEEDSNSPKNMDLPSDT